MPLLVQLRGVIQDRPLQPRSAQIRTAQVGTSEVCLAQIRTAEVRSGKVRTTQIRRTQVTSSPALVHHLPHQPPLGVDLGALVQDRTAQVGAAQVGKVQPCAPQVAPTQTRPR